MIRQLIAAFATAFALLHAQAAVDVNAASRADLETVKGIGPGMSAKIVEARKAGNFRSWADFVERVGGVGTGNAAKFSSAGLTVGGAAYTAGAVAPPASKARAARGEKTETAADKTGAARPAGKTAAPQRVAREGAPAAK